MPRKGYLKQPVLPLREMHLKAMEMIDEYEDSCALFLVAGKPTVTRCSSDALDGKLKRWESNLVGVYEGTVDSRYVFEDLEVFYQRRECRNGLV